MIPSYLQAQRIIPSPTCVEASPRKPIIDIDSLSYATRREVGRKHKRPRIDQEPSQQNMSNGRSNSELPLFLPTPSLRGTSQTPYRVNNVRAEYFEAPRTALSECKPLNIQGESANSPLSKRTKLEPITPVKIENGIRLWIDDRGVIDLTMDD
ncbi:hypothetical protein ACEPAF_1935 [Sanghuangporus sanghuang]